MRPSNAYEGRNIMPLPRLYTLKQLATALGDEVTVKLLRNEVQSGALKAMRFSDSPNAKIFVSESDAEDYIRNRGYARQLAPPPAGASTPARKAAKPNESTN